MRFDGKKIAAVVAIIGSAFYLMISGMAIPAQRAFIMTTVVLIGVLFNRRAISLRMVCFAALIILIISPQALVSISFQMSFAAVFALISFYETYEVKIASFKPQKNWALKIIWYLLGIVICGLVAGLAILPFALYHFHRVALYTSLANLLAGPLIALYIMPVILVCLIAFIFGVYSLPLKLLGFGIELLNRIAGIIADLPHSVWNAQLNFCGFICAVLGLYWLCVWQKPWRKWGFIPLFAGLMFLFYPHPQPDMVFAPNSSQILLKDNSGEMVMLPLKKDLWLQHLWEENFHLKKLSPSEKEKIKNLLSGNDNQENTLSLQCRADECLYKNQVRFNLDGNVFFDDKPVNTENGAYIYLPQKKFKPLWPTDCRPWKNCRPK